MLHDRSFRHILLGVGAHVHSIAFLGHFINWLVWSSTGDIITFLNRQMSNIFIYLLSSHPRAVCTRPCCWYFALRSRKTCTWSWWRWWLWWWWCDGCDVINIHPGSGLQGASARFNFSRRTTWRKNWKQIFFCWLESQEDLVFGLTFTPDYRFTSNVRVI